MRHQGIKRRAVKKLSYGALRVDVASVVRELSQTSSRNANISVQWRSQNEAEEAMALPETNVLRFFLVFCINFQLLDRRQ